MTERPHTESVRAAADALETAAAFRVRHNTAAVSRVTDSLLNGSLGQQPRIVDAAITRVLRSWVAQLWARGWLPVDVYQMARRNRSDLAANLAVDTIADNAAQYSAAAIHPRWREQLDELEAAQWWDPQQPHPSQWADRHGLDRGVMVNTMVELVALFMSMGNLPVIIPPPGRVAAGSAEQNRSGIDERMLGKIRALLAKAESTTFSDEAEALSAKAQELMARHSIQRAMAEAPHQNSEATASRIWLEPPYVGAKSLLVAEVASANHCRTVSYEKLGFVTVLGDTADLEAVELLSTSLMVQATRAMLGTGRQVTSTGRSRTRSFRHSFLIAYATRIGERLREVTEENVAATGAQLVPVFARREQAVTDLFGELFSGRIVKRSFSAGNADGYGAGRAAAEHANLSTQRTSVEPT
ncbi:DUF2786 domain-containing protein [Phytoactinopolyspora mesophila]|nr:DUF2786 domain-containing protein [Phytoactinopolyspora mesophila]